MRQDTQKILHITPHAGGGVGSVLRALLTDEAQSGHSFTHMLASLETLNDVTKTCLDSLGMTWTECADGDCIKELSAEADIVLLHWWNHPLLMKLMYEGLPASRLAIWAHVNGYFPPHPFFSGLFDMADIFVFATKTSLDSPLVRTLPDDMRSRFRVIRSCSGIPRGASSFCKKEAPFTMGYVGTVDPVKMHPEFLELCAASNIPTPCVVAGGPYHNELRSRAEALGLSDKFEILGTVPDSHAIFRRLHVFAYPLNPLHYGSGEQVLIEAMAFGAVPVVLGNPPERALIRHGSTGLVAEGKSEFSAALRFLAENPGERDRMAHAGYDFIMEKCPISRSREKFHRLFGDLLEFPKRTHRLKLPSIDGVQDGTPFHLFISSRDGCSEQADALSLANGGSAGKNIPPSFFLTTQGSPAHYLRFLGCDSKLEAVCRAVELKKSRGK